MKHLKNQPAAYIRALLVFCISSFFVTTITAASTVYAATPQITNLTTAGDSVGRYQKFEASFQISKSYPAGSFLPYYFYDATDTPSKYPNRNSPYGVDGISIDAHFTSQTGKTWTVPAFYFQEYVRSADTMTPTNTYMWKVRFAPMEVGTHTYYLTITDREGTTRYPASGTRSLNVTTSTSKGFVRVSPRDSRFMEFDNGESFIPNGSGRQWWRNGKRASFYETSFTEFAKSGVNFTRIWDQNDGYGLTVEGRYDAYKWPDDHKPCGDGQDQATKECYAKIPKGTQMNQRGNYDEDLILQSAEKNGIYIELSSHGDPYWIWDASIYDEPSWNPSPKTMNNPEHVNYWKRNFRYRIARWGYSTAIATWEVWNEHGHIAVGSDLANFYQTLFQYIQDVDPYDHLRTTSQGSQAWSPGFWSTAGVDVANYHDYMMPTRYAESLAYDTANFVYRFAQCLRSQNGSGCGLGIGDGSNATGPAKPYIWGELDTALNWDEAHIQPKAIHDMRWVGLFSPIGTTPLDWYWDQQSADFIAKKHADAKIVADFFKDIDYAGANFTYLSTADVRLTSTQVSATPANLRVLAMRAKNPNHAYAWVQNKANAMWNAGTNTTALSGSFVIAGMTPGTYSINYWNTSTGAQTSQTGVSVSSNGEITIPVTSLATDMAIKIRSSNYTPATPGPSSEPSPTPVATCPSDINSDHTVNTTDYNILVRDFLQPTLLNPRSDIDRSGAVNVTDYNIFVRAFLQPCPSG